MQRLIAYFIAAVLLAAGLVLTVANSQHALEVLAGAGSSEAAYRLGEYHSNSQNEEAYDLDRALRWFEQAAGSGDLEALYHVGQLHFTGSVKNHSYEAAYLSFLKGAEAGHVPSMHSLAMMYGLGLGVEQDLLAAEHWYQKVVNLGNAATQLNLALLYFNHPEAFGAEKAALAARELQKQADLGDATAVLTLGQALIEGNGVDQDVEKGIALLFEAAETEPDAAYLFLGSTYLRGAGGAADYAKAMEFFEKSAALGNDVATYELGQMWEHGLGVERDYVQAAALYREAIEGQYFAGLIALGTLHRDGKGVDQDYDKANRLFQRALEIDLPGSAASVGWMLIHGYGVLKDQEAGLRMIRDAADAGDYSGTYYYAELLRGGELVPRDHDRAVELYRVAADKGNQHAVTALKRLGIAP